MSKVVDRFLKYVKYETTSDENSDSVPSTSSQLDFAKEIVKELMEIGLEDITLDDNGYIMATLPTNVDVEVPTVGFISHMDTSPDMSGNNVNPKITENYDGGDIILSEEQNIVLSPKDFPELKNYIGKTLITTDGTTLLGADDKAGMAEIITAIEYLISNPDIKHGTVRIGFTPDEEIGRGADNFDVEKFGADFAYTMDGGPIGELEFENFNAAKAIIKIQGRNVHPGDAKGKMKNAIHIGMEFDSMISKREIPSETEGYEGFYHLNNFEGNVERATLYYIIRDFETESFENRKWALKKIADELNKKYSDGTVMLDLKDQYYNMKEIILKSENVVEIAKKAMKNIGIDPIIKPIRGGTDGARLSFMGLPTPNIFAGGHNFHGKYEFIPVFAMEKAVEIIVEIIKECAR